MTTEARLLPIEQVNALPPEAFGEALKPLFESAPPLAEALLAGRPYLSYDALLDRAADAIEQMNEAAQVAVINAHPRIGESAAAVRQQSAVSYREQGYAAEAGLDQGALAQVYEELAALNREYEQRFGFRFVEFVNGRPKAAILEVLRTRLHNQRDQERRTALEAMLLIARSRLHTFQAT